MDDSSNSNNNNNTCVICLEPLASDTIGTCVPCGHCFHERCWNGWKASSSSSLTGHYRNNPKCPMCNHVAITFCKIFLDLNGAMQNRDPFDGNTNHDNDELSWSSEVEEELDASPPQQQVNAAAEDAPPAASAINFVDLVNDDNDDDENSALLEKKARRYKQKSKSMLRHVKWLETQQSQKKEQLEQLAAKHKALQFELTRAKDEQHEREERYEANYQALDQANAALKRTRCEQAVASKEEQQLQQQVNKAITDLARLQENGKADMSKATVQNMPEVKRAMEEYPKVIASIERLELANANLQQQLDQLLLLHQQRRINVPQQQHGSSKAQAQAMDTYDNHHNNNSINTATINKKKSAKMLLLEMSRQREANERSQKEAAARLQRLHQERKFNSNLSQHAAKMGMMPKNSKSYNANHSATPMDSLALLNRAETQQQQSINAAVAAAASAGNNNNNKRMSDSALLPILHGVNKKQVSKKRSATTAAATGVNLSLRPAGTKRVVSRQTTLSFRVKK